MDSKLSVISEEVLLGSNVKIYDFVNIYGKAVIGADSVIGAFVEIQPGVEIGKRVKISSHTFICSGVTIQDNAFIGHGVMFSNDRYPKAVDSHGNIMTADTTDISPTVIEQGAAIGNGTCILSGVTIGKGSVVGAGSVITKDVPPYSVVCGNPAKVIRKTNYT